MCFSVKIKRQIGFSQNKPKVLNNWCKEANTTIFNDIDSLLANSLVECFLFSYFLWFP